MEHSFRTWLYSARRMPLFIACAIKNGSSRSILGTRSIDRQLVVLFFRLLSPDRVSWNIEFLIV